AVALASGAFVISVVLRTVALLRKQERSERRFTSLFRHSSDIVAVIDEFGMIRFISPSVERMLGYDSAALEGTSFVDLIEPESALRALEFFLAAEGGSAALPPRLELRMRRSDGSLLDVETLRTNLVSDPSVGGIVLNTRDITERKAFEQQLQHH